MNTPARMTPDELLNGFVEKHYGAGPFLRSGYNRLQAAIGRKDWKSP